MEDDFDYAEEFKSIDYDALKQDLNDLMTDSPDCGLQILVTMVLSLFVWPGMLPVLIALPMAAVAGNWCPAFCPT